MPSLTIDLFLQRQLQEVLQPKHDHQSHNMYTLIADTPQEAPQPDVVMTLYLMGEKGAGSL